MAAQPALDSTPGGNASPTRARGTRTILAIVLLGLVLRALLALAAGTPELQSDEANYTYLALSWNHLGFYGDSYRYLWPPGYPFLLAKAIDLFGMQGFEAIKLLQILASGVIGAATMLPAVSGYPHLTVPMGLHEGLPVGLSFIGPAWSEARLLAFGHAYELQRGDRPRPTYAARLP